MTQVEILTCVPTPMRKGHWLKDLKCLPDWVMMVVAISILILFTEDGGKSMDVVASMRCSANWKCENEPIIHRSPNAWYSVYTCYHLPCNIAYFQSKHSTRYCVVLKWVLQSVTCPVRHVHAHSSHQGSKEKFVKLLLVNNSVTD